jgi:hypothetical protein
VATDIRRENYMSIPNYRGLTPQHSFYIKLTGSRFFRQFAASPGLGAYLKSFVIVNIDVTAPMAVGFEIVCLDEVSFSKWTILRNWRTESASL